MVLAPHCCQRFSRIRLHNSLRIWAAALWVCGCLGCWEEVHYEPSEVASPPATAAEGDREEPPIEPELPRVEEVGETKKPDPPVVAVVPPGSRLAAWELASQWSMAVALQAKGVDAESYGTRLEQADKAARLLGVALPEMPQPTPAADQLATNLTYLLEDAGPRLAGELSRRNGTDHAALAELATKTHVLLLSYTPDSSRLEPVVSAIQEAAERSGLPEGVWRDLVDLLTARADFQQVKTAIYRLHDQAELALR